MGENVKQWVKAAGVRAIKTGAQAAVGAIGASATMGEVNWPLVGSTALLAAILSILTSIGGIPEVADSAPLARLAKSDKADAE